MTGTITGAGVPSVQEADRLPEVGYRAPIAAVVVLFPLGIIALAYARRSRRLGSEGLERAAGVAAAKARRFANAAFIVAVTAAIIVILIGLLFANNAAVARDFFSPAQLLDTMPLTLQGFKLNVTLFLVAEVFILVWSVLVAVVRLMPGRIGAPARALATLYVDVFRSLPALLVIFIVVYGLKRAGLPWLSELNDFWGVILALTLVYGAYMGEVIKGAIEEVHWSQVAAARSLGLSHLQTLRFVVMPPAMRAIVPPLLNGFISVQKETSLVTIVGLLDALNYAQIQALQNANLSAFTGVALCFLVTTVPLTRLADRMVKRDRARIHAK